MSKNNVLCTTCKNPLESYDEIYSSSCGHLYHYVCMRECQSRSTSCLECQQYNPTFHKMYLKFNECCEKNSSNNWNEKLKIIELNNTIEDCNNKFVHLQEKYAISQASLRKLEERVRKSDSSLSQSTSIVEDLQERISTLEELNKFLSIDNDCKTTALNLKSKEIAKLKSAPPAPKGKAKANEKVFKDQITNLEQTNENLKQQLDEEIQISSQLTTEKIKLEKLINLMVFKTNDEFETQNDTIKANSNENGNSNGKITDNILETNGNPVTKNATIIANGPTQKYINIMNLGRNGEAENKNENFSGQLTAESVNGTMKSNKIENKYTKVACAFNTSNSQLQNIPSSFEERKENKNPIANTIQSQAENKPIAKSKELSQSENLNSYTDNSILIKNVPKNKITYPLADFIAGLASTNRGNITSKNIVEAYIKDRNGKRDFQLPKNVTLFVRFENNDSKNKFIVSKPQQLFPSIEIIENKINEKTNYKDTTITTSQNCPDLSGQVLSAVTLPKNSCNDSSKTQQNNKNKDNYNKSKNPNGNKNTTVPRVDQNMCRNNSDSSYQGFSTSSFQNCPDLSGHVLPASNLSKNSSNEPFKKQQNKKNNDNYNKSKNVFEKREKKDNYNKSKNVYENKGTTVPREFKNMPRNHLDASGQGLPTSSFQKNRPPKCQNPQQLEVKNNEADTKSLLMYARQKLSGNEFAYIFLQNDEIIALKDRNDNTGIKIYSKSQVDKLFKFQQRK